MQFKIKWGVAIFLALSLSNIAFTIEGLSCQKSLELIRNLSSNGKKRKIDPKSQKAQQVKDLLERAAKFRGPEGIEFLKIALEIIPDHTGAMSLMAQLLVDMKRFEEANYFRVKVIQLESHVPHRLLELMLTFLRSNQLRSALGVADIYIERFGENASILEAKMLTFQHMGDGARASKIEQRLTQTYPDYRPRIQH